MDKRAEILNKLNEQGLMPLFYHADLQTSRDVVKALYAAGVRIIEYTNRGEAALTNFTALKKTAESEMPELFLGIGTIKNEDAANKFIDAGADFLVSPALTDDVFDVAYQNKMLWIPGCMTPTEILKAEGFGLSLVKLFPGNVLGPGYVSAIKDLFPEMKFMPTGGVETTETNLKDWFASGVCAVGMGSKLISSDILKSKDYTGITEITKAVLDSINQIKNAAKK